MQQQMFKLQISLNCAVSIENVVFEIKESVVSLKAVDVNWFHVIHVLANLMIG